MVKLVNFKSFVSQRTAFIGSLSLCSPAKQEQQGPDSWQPFHWFYLQVDCFHIFEQNIFYENSIYFQHCFSTQRMGRVRDR